MNNKAIILLLLSASLCTPLAAQTELNTQTEANQTEQQSRGVFGRRNNRRQVQQENAVLRSELDSLQLLLDSLRGRVVYEDEQELETLDRLDGNGFEYTTETSDSLLHLWYENSMSRDFDAVHEYNMDSIRFSSNVSDAEMMQRL